MIARTAALLLVLAVVAGCGGGTAGDGLAKNAVGRSVLDARESFAWGEGTETVFARFVDGDMREKTTRALLRAQPGEDHWFGIDGNGSWFEFRFEGDDLVVVAARNELYASSLFLEPPLRIGRAAMPANEPFGSESEFAATRGARRHEGTIASSVFFAGTESADTPMKRFDETVRLDSSFRLGLPFGLGLSIEQRQWLHPLYGEVQKTGAGTLKLLGAPVRTFEFREALVEARPLPADERDRMLMAVLDSKAKHFGAGEP